MSNSINELTQKVFEKNLVAEIETALKGITISPENARAIIREVHQHEEESMVKVDPRFNDRVKEAKETLGTMFAKRKAEGTETEGMLAPPQFQCTGCAWCGSEKEMHLHCPSCNMGMGNISKDLDNGVSHAVIMTEHAKILLTLVQWFKSQRRIGRVSCVLANGEQLSIEHCDELLEDLAQ